MQKAILKKIAYPLITICFIGVLGLMFMGSKEAARFSEQESLSLPSQKEKAEDQCPVEKIEEKTVLGSSMAPVLNAGDEVTALYGYYNENCPVQRGDIVLYDFSANPEPIVKFVKAVPGDRFEVKQSPEGAGWHLYVNNKIVKNSEGIPYLFSKPRANMLKLYEKDYNPLPKDTYLLLGNKPSGSLDSTRFGLVNGKSILAKVEYKY